MPPNHRRPDRVAEAIREEVANFLASGVKDPRIIGLVTVTGVDVTRDLRHARVFVSVLGTESEKASTFQGLASVAGHLRSHVGRALQLRLAPEISFKADESIAHASRIETLLAQIKIDTPPADAAAESEAPPGDVVTPRASDGDTRSARDRENAAGDSNSPDVAPARD